MNTDHGDSAPEHRDEASEGVDVPVHGVVIKRYPEGTFDEAAGDPVPTDERVMDAVLDALFKTDGDEWRVVAEAVIAAAAPLIAADRVTAIAKAIMSESTSDDSDERFETLQLAASVVRRFKSGGDDEPT